MPSVSVLNFFKASMAAALAKPMLADKVKAKVVLSRVLRFSFISTRPFKRVGLFGLMRHDMGFMAEKTVLFGGYCQCKDGVRCANLLKIRQI